jgi:2-polyprenyl-6-methoxyphenol hydroxylase-like FAD-dependent oxidoreductase
MPAFLYFLLPTSPTTPGTAPRRDRAIIHHAPIQYHRPKLTHSIYSARILFISQGIVQVQRMNLDVLVIGAGPVGLAMAAELARYGLSVRIVDKSSQPTDKSKALVLWSRTLEMFDRMGCTSTFVDAGLKVTAANIVAGNREIARITLNGVASPHPFALLLPQSDTERLLEQHLNNLGVEVERSTELQQFTAADDHVVSTLINPQGQQQTVSSQWLIGCDGAHSAVRHELQMDFVGDTMPSNWVLADVQLAGAPNPGEITVLWHTDGVLVIFPIKHDRYRVIADVGDTVHDTAPADPTLDDVQALLDRRGPGGVQASSPLWLAGFQINERKIANYRAGRVFLVGDAAHIHSPAGGQGMNTGIQDACNLAWKLALVTRNLCASEPLLSSYSIERSAVGDEVLKNAGRLTSIAIMKGEARQSIRNHLAALVFGLSPVRRLAADTLTELSIGYPNSPLTISHPHFHHGPSAGDRAPIRESEIPVSTGNTPRFAVFAKADQACPQFLALYSALVEPTLRQPFHEDGLWLVRPDGYIALATKSGDWQQAAAFLDTLTI